MPRINKSSNTNVAVDAMEEVNQRVNQLESEFSHRLSKFKEELLLHKSSESLNFQQSEDLLSKFQEFEISIMADVNKLKDELKKACEKFDLEIDNINQKANNKFLLVHGLEESESKEDICTNILNLFNTKLQIPVEKAKIADCYHLGKKHDKDKKRPRTVVVEFIHKYVRDDIYYKKKVLKGTKLLITELLTRARLEIFRKCSGVRGLQCWTLNGNIIVLQNGKKTSLSNKHDMKNYLNIN